MAISGALPPTLTLRGGGGEWRLELRDPPRRRELCRDSRVPNASKRRRASYPWRRPRTPHSPNDQLPPGPRRAHRSAVELKAPAPALDVPNDIMGGVATLVGAAPVCARCLAFRFGRPHAEIYEILQ